MGYKVKRIMVGDKQVRPGKVQVFDFENDGDLGWTAHGIGYGTPFFTTGVGWKISKYSGDNIGQGGITIPSSVFTGTLSKIKIYWNKSMASNVANKGQAVGICNGAESTLVDYTRNNHNITIYPGGSKISATDVTGDITSEYIMEDNGNLTLKINGTSYNVGAYGNTFKSLRSSKDFEIMIGFWYTETPIIKKIEITTV